jgi:hypothetical protein
VGQEADKTAGLAVTPVDARRPILDGLLPGQTRLNLRPGTVVDALDALIDHYLPTDCGLVLHLDLLLAALNATARDEAWDLLYSHLPHRGRALLLTVPADAAHLLPGSTALDQWRKEERLAERY